MDGIYYLTILIDLEGCPQDYPGWLLATMREYAEDTDTTRAVLQEHGHLLLVSDAIHELQRLIWYDYFSITIYPGPDCNFFDQFDSNSFCEVIGV